MENIKSTSDKITTFWVPSPYWISISSDLVTRTGLSFWTYNQILVHIFIYFCFKSLALWTFGKPTISGLFWYPIFTKRFFIKLTKNLTFSNLCIWFLSLELFDLHTHWKSLCKKNLSSLITSKVFSVMFFELPELLRSNIRPDIFFMLKI